MNYGFDKWQNVPQSYFFELAGRRIDYDGLIHAAMQEYAEAYHAAQQSVGEDVEQAAERLIKRLVDCKIPSPNDYEKFYNSGIENCIGLVKISQYQASQLPQQGSGWVKVEDAESVLRGFTHSILNPGTIRNILSQLRK